MATSGEGISVKQRSYLRGGVRLNSSTVLGITQGNNTPRFTDFFTDLEKNPTVLQSKEIKDPCSQETRNRIF